MFPFGFPLVSFLDATLMVASSPGSRRPSQLRHIARVYVARSQRPSRYTEYSTYSCERHHRRPWSRNRAPSRVLLVVWAVAIGPGTVLGRNRVATALQGEVIGIGDNNSKVARGLRSSIAYESEMVGWNDAPGSWMPRPSRDSGVAVRSGWLSPRDGWGNLAVSTCGQL